MTLMCSVLPGNILIAEASDKQGGTFMGIFSHYVGNMDIPEADRPEYARQALELLRAGGMMSVDHIHLYGKSIHLLFPPELNDEGKSYGYYNYLDEESWETWGHDGRRRRFYSNKNRCKMFLFHNHCGQYSVRSMVKVLRCGDGRRQFGDGEPLYRMDQRRAGNDLYQLACHPDLDLETGAAPRKFL